MSPAEPDKTLMQAMVRIDALLRRAEEITDPAVRENVTEIMRGLLDLHGQALARLLELLAQSGQQAQPLIAAMEADQLISSVLLVHDLHPSSTEQRVQRALQQVQPYLAAHSGRVELLAVTPQGVARLRLASDCRGCAASQAKLSNLINEAIYAAAPEVVAIELDGGADGPLVAGAVSAPAQLAPGERCDCSPAPAVVSERRS